jgi:hypothetical protein
VLSALLEVDAAVAAEHEAILLICDKGFAGREFETLLGEYGITMLRPSRDDETARYGEPLLKKVRRLIESVNDTLNSIWRTTADAASPAARSASPSACWRWPPRSGTTTPPAHRSPDH